MSKVNKEFQAHIEHNDMLKLDHEIAEKLRSKIDSKILDIALISNGIKWLYVHGKTENNKRTYSISINQKEDQLMARDLKLNQVMPTLETIQSTLENYQKYIGIYQKYILKTIDKQDIDKIVTAINGNTDHFTLRKEENLVKLLSEDQKVSELNKELEYNQNRIEYLEKFESSWWKNRFNVPDNNKVIDQ